MKLLKPLLALSIIFACLNVQAGSFIRVINLSDHYLQAIWQAGGCADVVYDWADDRQHTVCDKLMITPGKEGRYDFGLFHSDRSVKVFLQGGERIAYCNSMDNSSITVTRGIGQEVEVAYNCP